MRENKKMPVKVSGVAEVLTAMRKFEPDLAKNLNREMRVGMTPIQKKAQAYTQNPSSGLSNWLLNTQGKKINKATSAFATIGRFPKFNVSIARKGIKISTGRSKKSKGGFVVMYRISNTSRAGQIMEMAGRVNPAGSPKSRSNNPHAGEHFIKAMPGGLAGAGKQKGRLLYKAAQEDQGRTTALLLRGLEASIAQFHERAKARNAFTL